MKTSRKDVTVMPPPAAASAAFPAPSFAVIFDLSQAWFCDARWEAENPQAVGNYHYRRREVIFAVCFAEAYLFEWTLAALGLDGDKLTRYFPISEKGGIADRWAKVPAALHQDGFLKADLRVSKKHRKSWQNLIDIRNGLTHSKASWPEVVGREVRHPKPIPRLLDLGAKPPGWALAIAKERVLRLHAAAGTSAPPWITAPTPFCGCPSCQRP
jgi:hypothetical protein